MREPALKNLRVNKKETEAIRSLAKKAKKKFGIKITINIDSDTLSALREMSDKTGIPYQRLLNNLLREKLISKKEKEDRLDKIEKELSELKQKLAA